AVGEEQVEQPVAVVVDHGDAAAKRFEDRALVGLLAVAVGEVDSGVGGHVAEPGRAVRHLGRVASRVGRPGGDRVRRGVALRRRGGRRPEDGGGGGGGGGGPRGGPFSGARGCGGGGAGVWAPGGAGGCG